MYSVCSSSNFCHYNYIRWSVLTTLSTVQKEHIWQKSQMFSVSFVTVPLRRYHTMIKHEKCVFWAAKMSFLFRDMWRKTWVFETLFAQPCCSHKNTKHPLFLILFLPPSPSVSLPLSLQPCKQPSNHLALLTPAPPFSTYLILCTCVEPESDRSRQERSSQAVNIYYNPIDVLSCQRELPRGKSERKRFNSLLVGPSKFRIKVKGHLVVVWKCSGCPCLLLRLREKKRRHVYGEVCPFHWSVAVPLGAHLNYLQHSPFLPWLGRQVCQRRKHHRGGEIHGRPHRWGHYGESKDIWMGLTHTPIYVKINGSSCKHTILMPCICSVLLRRVCIAWSLW